MSFHLRCKDCLSDHTKVGEALMFDMVRADPEESEGVCVGGFFSPVLFYPNFESFAFHNFRITLWL